MQPAVVKQRAMQPAVVKQRAFQPARSQQHAPSLQTVSSWLATRDSGQRESHCAAADLADAIGPRTLQTLDLQHHRIRAQTCQRSLSLSARGCASGQAVGRF
eukprot:1510433-Rhodomonas_salina.1